VSQPIKKCACQKAAYKKSNGNLKGIAREKMPNFKREVSHSVSNKITFNFIADAQQII
jgi:hypothetical protein